MIVDDPKKGLREDNIILKETGITCKHLRGTKIGEYSCAVHHHKWYKKTPCYQHGQIERSKTDECRMGRYIINQFASLLDCATTALASHLCRHIAKHIVEGETHVHRTK
jgi:hypothetical protein